MSSSLLLDAVGGVIVAAERKNGRSVTSESSSGTGGRGGESVASAMVGWAEERRWWGSYRI